MDALRELADTRQVPGEPKRRWFSSPHLDLIVWVDAAEKPVGFQLCYDKNAGEHAFTWREGRGYDHCFVDDGEDSGLIYKGTPILRADGYFDRARVKTLFLQACGDVPETLRQYVSERLDDYPERPK